MIEKIEIKPPEPDTIKPPELGTIKTQSMSFSIAPWVFEKINEIIDKVNQLDQCKEELDIDLKKVIQHE